jgi:hypothetical protein
LLLDYHGCAPSPLYRLGGLIFVEKLPHARSPPPSYVQHGVNLRTACSLIWRRVNDAVAINNAQRRANVRPSAMLRAALDFQGIAPIDASYGLQDIGGEWGEVKIWADEP